ncbi:cyclase [Bordetella pertussis]|nr:cyclase [Bordetella pertussis]
MADGKDLKTIYREVYDFMKPRYSQWVIFDHCMPFNVSRATGHYDPRIWTDKRDIEMWQQLEG